MNKSLMIAVLMALATVLPAQKYDYRWLTGYWPNQLNDLMFSDTGVHVQLRASTVEMDNSQVTISDSLGNLLFYSNGAKVYNVNDTVMSNGDSINYGALWDVHFGQYYPELEDIVALPALDGTDKWNMFHCWMADNISGIGRIYQTQVDMNLDSSRGSVVFKNKTIVEESLGTYVTACKHGNGRDWWIFSSLEPHNCFFQLLYQPDTIIRYPDQCIGADYLHGDAGQACFSPDGSKFAVVKNYTGVDIFDFDRCTGELSNPVNLPMFYFDTNPYSQWGAAFSPNSRFLYITYNIGVIQFDLWAADIYNSRDTVGFYQLYSSDSAVNSGTFFLEQLGPDGKIYISANNGIKALHVINDADKKGDSCNFVNYGLRLQQYNTFGLPNYPNYRLGREVGSGCDTIYHDTIIDTTHVGLRELRGEKRAVRLFPNPATDHVVLDYGNLDWSYGPMQLEVTDETGRVIMWKQLPMYSGFQQIDITKWSAGYYLATVKRGGTVIASKKLIKQ